jgi:von Willebrand factor type A domain-containing protein
MRRSVPFISLLGVAVIVFLFFAGTRDAPTQDGEPTATAAYVFPTVPTFQVPGDIQTPGELETATAFATVKPEPSPIPAPGSIRVVGAETKGARVSLGKDIAVELILDTSGSMLEELAPGRTRIDVAKEVISRLVRKTPPGGVPVALRVFGDEPDSCDTKLAVPLAPLNAKTMAATIEGIELVNLVNTPLGAALEAVKGDLADATGPKIVVLVTDGEETCGGDPEAAIRALRKAGLDVHVNIVGFALDDDALKKTFRHWAKLGHGSYFDATGADDLGDAIVRAVQPPFTILDADAKTVGTGIVGGGPVSVPAVTYTVEVQTDPTTTFADVVVEGGKNV